VAIASGSFDMARHAFSSQGQGLTGRHRPCQLQLYCSEELGGFYLDVLKDRLYTAATHSAARRSAQTVLAHVRDELLKLMAPILSFTAEEAWKVLYPDDATIFAHVWNTEHSLGAIPDLDALTAKWSRIVEVRNAVLKRLEEAREKGEIGSSLAAELTIAAPANVYEALASLGDDLRFVMITSSAKVRRGDALAIEVTPSTHPKCARCWHWRSDVGADAAHPALCGRCVANLFGDGEVRAFA
jgi:isoleucyl-tRNA synthetase